MIIIPKNVYVHSEVIRGTEELYISNWPTFRRRFARQYTTYRLQTGEAVYIMQKNYRKIISSGRVHLGISQCEPR
jgi:hypothetical protein